MVSVTSELEATLVVQRLISLLTDATETEQLESISFPSADVATIEASLDALEKDSLSLLPHAEVRMLVSLLEVKETCCDLDANAFVIVLRTLLQAEEYLDQHRGIYLLAESLDPRQVGDKANCVRSRLLAMVDAKKIHVGQKVMARLFHIFSRMVVADDQFFQLRRVIGILLCRITDSCEANTLLIECLPERVRRRLGKIILQEDDQILRVLAGRIVGNIIRDGEYPAQDLWPANCPKRIWSSFPSLAPTQASSELLDDAFQKYIQNIRHVSACSVTPLHEYRGLSVETNDETLWKDKHVHLYKYNNYITFFVTSPIEFLDVPVELVKHPWVESDASILHNGKDITWIHLSLHSNLRVCCILNARPIKCTRITMALAERQKATTLCEHLRTELPPPKQKIVKNNTPVNSGNPRNPFGRKADPDSSGRVHEHKASLYDPPLDSSDGSISHQGEFSKHELDAHESTFFEAQFCNDAVEQDNLHSSHDVPSRRHDSDVSKDAESQVKGLKVQQSTLTALADSQSPQSSAKRVSAYIESLRTAEKIQIDRDATDTVPMVEDQELKSMDVSESEDLVDTSNMIVTYSDGVDNRNWQSLVPLSPQDAECFAIENSSRGTGHSMLVDTQCDGEIAQSRGMSHVTSSPKYVKASGRKIKRYTKRKPQKPTNAQLSRPRKGTLTTIPDSVVDGNIHGVKKSVKPNMKGPIGREMPRDSKGDLTTAVDMASRIGGMAMVTPKPIVDRPSRNTRSRTSALAAAQLDGTSRTTEFEEVIKKSVPIIAFKAEPATGIKKPTKLLAKTPISRAPPMADASTKQEGQSKQSRVPIPPRAKQNARRKQAAAKTAKVKGRNSTVADAKSVPIAAEPAKLIDKATAKERIPRVKKARQKMAPKDDILQTVSAGMTRSPHTGAAAGHGTDGFVAAPLTRSSTSKASGLRKTLTKSTELEVLPVQRHTNEVDTKISSRRLAPETISSNESLLHNKSSVSLPLQIAPPIVQSNSTTPASLQGPVDVGNTSPERRSSRLQKHHHVNDEPAPMTESDGLLSDRLARKQQIIHFSLDGPRNQGTMSGLRSNDALQPSSSEKACTSPNGEAQIRAVASLKTTKKGYGKPCNRQIASDNNRIAQHASRVEHASRVTHRTARQEELPTEVNNVTGVETTANRGHNKIDSMTHARADPASAAGTADLYGKEGHVDNDDLVFVASNTFNTNNGQSTGLGHLRRPQTAVAGTSFMDRLRQSQIMQKSTPEIVVRKRSREPGADEFEPRPTLKKTKLDLQRSRQEGDGRKRASFADETTLVEHPASSPINCDANGRGSTFSLSSPSQNLRSRKYTAFSKGLQNSPEERWLKALEPRQIGLIASLRVANNSLVRTLIRKEQAIKDAIGDFELVGRSLLGAAEQQYQGVRSSKSGNKVEKQQYLLDCCLEAGRDAEHIMASSLTMTAAEAASQWYQRQESVLRMVGDSVSSPYHGERLGLQGYHVDTRCR